MCAFENLDWVVNRYNWYSNYRQSEKWKRKRKITYRSKHAISWYWRERCSLLQQELKEINCSVLQPSPTGSDDYFVERSIFFILESLCSERYNKSLCKTFFMSILSPYNSQNNKFVWCALWSPSRKTKGIDGRIFFT